MSNFFLSGLFDGMARDGVVEKQSSYDNTSGTSDYLSQSYLRAVTQKIIESDCSSSEAKEVFKGLEGIWEF
jgi:hypothetical protein